MNVGPTLLQKRVGAAALVGGVIIGVAVIYLAAASAMTSLSEYRLVRDRNQQAAQLVAGAVPVKIPSAMRNRLLPRDAKLNDSEMLARLLQSKADAQGLTLEMLPADEEQQGVDTGLFVTVTGPSAAVLAWIASMEQADPLVRFSDWQLNVVDGQISFAGMAKAVAL